MTVPLGFIRELPPPPVGTSWGDHIAHYIDPQIHSFLDCFPSTTRPAIFSPDATRPPLCHDTIREFVASFSLPSCNGHARLGPNDRVMVALPTTPESALALLALSCYHTVAPVNTACTAAELLEDARRLNVRAILSTRAAEDRLGLVEIAAELGCAIFYLDARGKGPVGLFDLHLMDGDNASHPRAGSSVEPSRLCNLEDQSLVLQTSGTSGKKKVVPYPLRNLIVGTCAVIRSWDLREDDKNLNMMPLFHVGGIVRNLFAPILSGGSVVMCPGFDAGQFWTIAVDRGITWYYAAPTMHQAILSAIPDSVLPSRDTKLRLVCNAAGGLLPTLAEQLKDTFGAIILPSYGSTECMPIASPPTSYRLDRPGCSGVACGPYLSIRDPHDIDRECRRGETGAICVRGLPAFTGYEIVADRSAPLDTSAFSRDGWFDTGDCGLLDDDGYLFITGRSKEIINRGGEVISPFEVEEAILVVAGDRVKETIAFSVDHDVLQETVGVVVVPKPDVPRISLSQVQDLLKRQLHPSKWPFAVVYMDAVPKNSSGKPLRINLASRLGLGTFSDSSSTPLSRHFEAIAPNPNTPLTQPIPCSGVTLNVSDAREAIISVPGVHDAAVRVKTDGSLEAFVAVASWGVDGSAVTTYLSDKVPGYAIPSYVHVVLNTIPRKDGDIDFAALELDVRSRNSEIATGTCRTVCSIVADLLGRDPSTISPSSDFFLLGGNSLLLGRLSYIIRKETGVALSVPDLFANTTMSDIASLVDVNRLPDHGYGTSDASDSTLVFDDLNKMFIYGGKADTPAALSQRRSWGQTHPVSLIVQAIPTVFFYPLKAAWTWMVVLMLLSCITHWDNFWDRACGLVLSIIAARLSSRILCPLAAIIFKWIVIGKYKPGVYKFWSTYHLRWWIVNAALRSAGRGIFTIHPELIKLYFQLLGARIGKNVQIDTSATLSECDLLTLQDGCCVDHATVSGFCVERDGYFRLAPITIGRNVVINTYTQIAPGTTLADGTVYGPHASSHDPPSSSSAASCNRTKFPQPHPLIVAFIGWPIIATIMFISYIPWLAAIYCMVQVTSIQSAGLNPTESVIVWFSQPRRIAFHIVARLFRDLLRPLVQVVLGIALKRIMGMSRPEETSQMSQWSLLRRYINQTLLSRRILQQVGDVVGTHYEMTSIIWRAMGAKVGKRVYWPGSGIYCPDPEFLEIGDDVVFGSRSEFFTSDGLGAAKITIGNGAMVADRAVLLPGCHVGSRTIIGSGALTKRHGVYDDGSVWIGNDGGEAIMLSRHPQGADAKRPSTITPYGRAFCQRDAPYFVLPYAGVALLNFSVSALSSAFWASTAISGAQILRVFLYRLRRLDLFASEWYRIGILYGLIAMSFVVFLSVQSIIAMIWVIITKWIVIGKRVEGSFPWDRSSYCQRWQTHLTLSRPLYRGRGIGGVLAPLTGSAYIVWFYRAMGARIGQNCAVWAGGKVGLMTEPDLVELGDNVALDNASVVSHINSRGNFQLNRLKIGNGCAMRTGSRLLSGACMEDNSMLLEHTLLPSGEIADARHVYSGWPARPVPTEQTSKTKILSGRSSATALSSEKVEKIC